MTGFGTRLIRAIHRAGTPLCLGLDPFPDHFPGPLRERIRGGGREAAARAIEDFCHEVLDRGADLVPAVKFQSACFEAYGADGVRALEQSIARAKERGLLVILDAKRGDIASTATAYAQAIFGGAWLPEGPAGASGVDAATVTPYVGAETLDPFLDRCRSTGLGLFVLCRTSNPGSGWLQERVSSDGPLPEERLYEAVAREIARRGDELLPGDGLAPVGAVVGATWPEALQRVRRLAPRAPLLVPGVGAQGAGIRAVAEALEGRLEGVLVPVSRSVLYGAAGEEKGPGAGGADWARAIRDRLERVRDGLAGAIDQG